MKKAGIILLAAAVLAAGVTAYRLTGGLQPAVETLAAEPDGRSRISARILSITGNQMTYRKLADLSETEAESSSAGPDGSEGSGEAEIVSEPEAKGSGAGPEGSAGSSDTETVSELEVKSGDAGQDGSMGSGDAAEVSGGSRNRGKNRPDSGDTGMPARQEGISTGEGSTGTEGEEAAERPARPEGISAGEGSTGTEGGGAAEQPARPDGDFTGGKPGENSGRNPTSETGSSGTGEKLRGSRGDFGQDRETIYIPVSVPVYSDTGKELTYTILQAGDTITIQTDRTEDGSEVITGIWLTAKSE